MNVYTSNMLITVWYCLNQFAFNLDFQLTGIIPCDWCGQYELIQTTSETQNRLLPKYKLSIGFIVLSYFSLFPASNYLLDQKITNKTVKIHRCLNLIGQEKTSKSNALTM